MTGETLTLTLPSPLARELGWLRRTSWLIFWHAGCGGQSGTRA